MDLANPRFRPDPDRSREEMEALQREIAAAAVFEDDLGFDPASVTVDRAAGRRSPGATDAGQQSLGATGNRDSPVVAGVDQAFLDDDRAVSAVVALRDGEVIETATAVAGTTIPYVPGLLSFREGTSILAAFADLSVTPDLAMFDGSGRIHFREAGLATHVGVTLDVPSVGVAKSLLCGTPDEPLPDRMPEGARVAIRADEDVTAPGGTVVGYAFQSRQYDSRSTSINPLYVSPGHRVSAGTAVDVVERTCAGYKLPEPTRLADRAADEARADLA